MKQTTFNRRQFVRTSAAAVALPIVGGTLATNLTAASTQPTFTPPRDEVALKGRIWKTLKIGMTEGVKGTLTDKFNAAKAAGFAGIEMDSPGMNVEETKIAIAESGLPVDGTVCSTHWQVTHTNPDAAVRAQALADLQTAIRDTRAVGGSTVLLVAGHGKDGTPEEIWKRAVENIQLAIPLAAELGIHIVIENVWNHFMYDHDATGHDQTAEHYVRFVDEFDSPWLGMQFDIGNHWKYGSMGDWIRQLGRRVVKLDIKGFSRAENKFTNIGAGDLDWADVRAALLEINYYGWCAAEVGGGDEVRLKEISNNMDRVLGLV